MYRNAVFYKGVWLCPGSDSLLLYQLKKFEELDKHLAEQDRVWRKLEGRP